MAPLGLILLFKTLRILVFTLLKKAMRERVWGWGLSLGYRWELRYVARFMFLKRMERMGLGLHIGCWADVLHFFLSFQKGRFIMGNKVARTIAFFYTLLLHSLVFLVSILTSDRDKLINRLNNVKFIQSSVQKC